MTLSKKQVDKWTAITNTHLSRMIGKERYWDYVSSFLCDSDDKYFFANINKFLENPMSSSALNFNAKKFSEISKSPAFGSMDKKRIIDLYRAVFLKSALILNDFIKIRDNFEKDFIIGQFDSANTCLDNILCDFGESLWYLRSKTLLLSYCGGINDVKEFCDYCKSECHLRINSNLISKYQIIFDSDSAYLHLKELVIKEIAEMQKAGEYFNSCFFGLIYVPDPLIASYDYMESVLIPQAMGVIDQYSYISDILIRKCADSNKDNDYFIKTLSKIGARINDCRITKFIQTISDDGVRYTKFTFIDELYCLYNKGDYKRVVARYIEIIHQVSNPLAYVNIIAKACAYLGADNSFPTSFGILSDLINLLKRAYELSGSQKQLEEDLLSISIKLNGFSLRSQVQIATYKVFYRNFDRNHIAKCAQMCMLESAEYTILTQKLSQSNGTYLDKYEYTCEKNAPPDRLIKRQLIEMLINDEKTDLINEKFDEYKKFVILKRDFYELKADYYLSKNNIDELLSFVVEVLSVNQEAYSCLPMFDLVAIVERDYICTLKAVVFLRFYTRLVSAEKISLLNELFEGYIYCMSAKRPSELLIQKRSLDEIEVVFYRDICIPDIMDSLGCFSCVRDVCDERLFILDWLYEYGVITYTYRIQEVEKIINQMIIDDGSNNLNIAKINVDGDAIIEKNHDNLHSLYELYKETLSEEGDSLIVVNETEIFDESTQGVGYVSGNKNSLLIRFINILSNAFMFDDEYGLDKNLSSEIRHGFFGNLMLAEIQDRHLITEKDEFDVNKSNEYWRGVYSIIVDELWGKIDNCLSNFTTSVNNHIQTAENWMKFDVNGKNKESLFKIGLIFSEDFDRVKEIADISDNYHQVSHEVISIMWEQTENCLESIRQKIASDFQNGFDVIFDDLISSLNSVKRAVVLGELFDSILAAKGKVKEDVATVVAWFQRGTSNYSYPIAFDQVVNVALNLYYQIKRNCTNINKIMAEDVRLYNVEGHHVRPIVLALINLIDNCYRHSGLLDNTNVELRVNFIDGQISIQILNDMEEIRYESLTETMLSEINYKIGCEGSLDFMRSEGGTGIRKAYNHISSTGVKNSMKISVEDRMFKVEVRYGD